MSIDPSTFLSGDAGDVTDPWRVAKRRAGEVAYDATEDFTNITYIGFTPNVLVISPEIPVRSLAELIALAKRDPGRLIEDR